MVRKIKNVLKLKLQATKISDLSISAASGLVCAQDWLYVISDDQLYLYGFKINKSVPTISYKIFAGELPEERKARKKKKPDFEALTILPSHPAWPYGALLIVPSGSRANRIRGSIVSLKEDGSLIYPPRSINFQPLYTKLSLQILELNIEGALVINNTLKLFQRGNGSSGRNMIIDINLEAIIAAFANGQHISYDSPEVIKNIVNYELGELNDVRLSFTDASVLNKDEFVFLATAENTKDTYNDGPSSGSVIGIMDKRGIINYLAEIEPCIKAEGLSVKKLDNGNIEVLFVTDADDPNIKSELYQGILVRKIYKHNFYVQL